MESIFVKAADRIVKPTAHGMHVMKGVVYAQEFGILPKGSITQIAVAELPVGRIDENPHKHDTMWEVYFSLAGRAVYHVGGNQYCIEPGDFLAIPPGTLHIQDVTEAPHVIYYFGLAVD